MKPGDGWTMCSMCRKVSVQVEAGLCARCQRLVDGLERAREDGPIPEGRFIAEFLRERHRRLRRIACKRPK